MENFTVMLCFALVILLFTYHSVAIIIIYKKRKEFIIAYERVLNLKEWCDKISEEAGQSYIIESVEKRGNELINKLNLLNAKLVKIQEHHKNLQERQQKLHDSLLEEHKLLNQYFENYS